MGLAEVNAVIDSLPVSEQVRGDARAVYALIGEAESKAHGKDLDAVHFHEVGMLDAVADVVGVSLLMEMLAPARVVVSPIHVGSGLVRTQHGVLPVPAPATAYILRGVPTYAGTIRGELATPTGAALLRHFATDWGSQPAMTVEAIGYGMGTKDFAAANCVRTFLGRETAAISMETPVEVVEIVCNLDDMTGEELGFAMEVLLSAGALDVWHAPIYMKKQRPAWQLSCLVRAEEQERFEILMLRQTTSFGVRSRGWTRRVLERAVETVETKRGPVRLKRGRGEGIERRSLEYEDLARIAKESGESLVDLRREFELL